MRVRWLALVVITGAAITARAQGPSRDPQALPEEPETGVAAWIEVRNEMGKQFKLTEAHFYLDGGEIARRVAPPDGELESSFRAFDGKIPPGGHVLKAELHFELRNRGPFNYLENYRFRAQTDFVFSVREGAGPAAVDVVARENKGPNVPPQKRPVIDIQPAPGSQIPRPVRTPLPPVPAPSPAP